MKELMSNFGGLRQENSGSMFPKMTLACLKSGITLAKEDALELMRIVADVSNEFIKVRNELHMHTHLSYDTIHACIFQCCSLERLIVSHAMRLRDGSSGDNRRIIGDNDRLAVQDEIQCQNAVTKVLEEASEKNIDTYSEMIQREGNREDHYRKDRWGGTCVAFAHGNYEDKINEANNEILSKLTTILEERIPQRLKDYYVFFDRGSLHVTVRAIL